MMIYSLRVNELKELLKFFYVSAKGNKRDLRERVEHLLANPGFLTKLNEIYERRYGPIALPEPSISHSIAQAPPSYAIKFSDVPFYQQVHLLIMALGRWHHCDVGML